MQDVAILGAKRTPIGGLLGRLSTLPAPALGAAAIKGALSATSLEAEQVGETLMGIVLSAGVGQAPARQAGLGAGLPQSTTATTISKVCGSGLRAVIDGCQRISTGECDYVVSGGMESMSNAPHLMMASRTGTRLGHGEIKDHMFCDGLEDAYDVGRLMGRFAELCATEYGFSRELQDDFALSSLERAQAASDQGVFGAEIVPVSVPSRNAEQWVDRDEQPDNALPEKVRLLRPAFAPNGSVTAANASSISDGAAALVLGGVQTAVKAGHTIRARIVGWDGYAQDPAWFTTAPVAATQKLLKRIGWATSDVDLWEVNEAFAVVALAFMRDLDVPHDRLNVNGGACALGHPIGASGARILVTLLHALEARDLKRGIATICIGGGEALTVAIERA